MKYLLQAAIVLGISLSSLYAQIELTEAVCQSAHPVLGDTLTISTKVQDPNARIDIITVRLKEFPSMVLVLTDKGHLGDAIKGDGIWSTHMRIMEYWDPGPYTWEFRAYDKDNKRLTISGKEDGNFAGAEAGFEVHKK
ncbi:MAG: hypothetical protein AAF587_05790 [Bacteroidota bacterium]